MLQPQGSLLCPDCGKPFQLLGRHKCRPVQPDHRLPATKIGSAVPEERGTEQDAVGAMIEQDALREELSAKLLDARYEHGFDDGDIKVVKQVADFCMQHLRGTAHLSLQHLLRPGVTEDEVAAALGVTSAFDGLETKQQEMAYATANVAYLKPREVELDDESMVVSFDIFDLIVRKLQNDAKFRKAVIAKSEEWKRGDKWCKPPEEKLSGIDDGIAARYHARLMRPATEEEKEDVRLALLKQADDIEVRQQRHAAHERQAHLAIALC